MADDSLPERACDTKQCAACAKCPIDYICSTGEATCACATNPRSCSQECPQWKCVRKCPKGQYYNEMTRECVTLAQCQNETCAKCKDLGLGCGPITVCKGTCSGLENPETCVNTTIYDCVCPGRYVFESTNPSNPICVNKTECSLCEKCKANGLECAEIDLCGGMTTLGCICSGNDQIPSQDVTCYNSPECPCKECPIGVKCVNNCSQTCDYLVYGICPRDGAHHCECPEGQYFNGATCVKADECPGYCDGKQVTSEECKKYGVIGFNTKFQI